MKGLSHCSGGFRLPGLPPAGGTSQPMEKARKLHALSVSTRTREQRHPDFRLRAVGGGRANVAGRYPSRKMGVTIQFESHRVELAFLRELEHDPDVLEFYDQPPSFRLEYRSVCGRRVVVSHTPDYFVIRKNGAEWHECKTEEELEELAKKQPNRYCRRTGGGWSCPPGESHAIQFGFSYRVRSCKEV